MDLYQQMSQDTRKALIKSFDEPLNDLASMTPMLTTTFDCRNSKFDIAKKDILSCNIFTSDQEIILLMSLIY